jgi:putative tryptophan/tyrosine transport system substrate-binding protein
VFSQWRTAGERGRTAGDLIITLAARHKLPTVYFERHLTAAGGLMAYGPDFTEQYRRAAGYVDRILKGERSADLPVQSPTKYELVINLKTARSLGFETPPSLLARATELIAKNYSLLHLLASAPGPSRHIALSQKFGR